MPDEPRFPASTAWENCRGFDKGKESFGEAYLSLPPWTIDRPQGEIIRLAKEGEIRRTVLDSGCGTGGNALFPSDLGYEVTGIDAAGAAIRKAKEIFRGRRAPAVFPEWDALGISGLGNVHGIVGALAFTMRRGGAEGRSSQDKGILVTSPRKSRRLAQGKFL
jgi:SAM-dependent methyltransferase